MLTAIRRTKSLPAWLALIAAAMVVATLGTVIVNSVMQTHSASTNASNGALAPAGAALSHSRDDAAATPDVNSASRNPDAAAGQASQAQAATASSAVTMAAASDAFMDLSGMASGTQASAADASSAATAAHAAALRRAQARAAAAHSAARRRAAIERGEGSLRADIARYNADRQTGVGVAPLRSAIVPSLHSLWDDIPGPMSNVYRN